MPTLNTKPPKSKTTKCNSKQEAQKIYNSQIWKALRLQRLMAHPICERCNKAFANEVHHIVPFMKYSGEKRLEVAYDEDNLIALCPQCHDDVHNEMKDVRGKRKAKWY